ncbi:MAG: type II toxin-antitoxin system VapC family toxin [Candidatus Binatia bacterium]
MIIYLDTSVVLRVLLKEPKPLRSWGDWEEAASSDLMGVEARRAIDRSRLDAALDDEQVAELHQQLRQVEIRLRRIAVNRRILGRAAQPMATAVKTLDAIHLASALVFQEARGASVLFATHDGRQATAARALGFDCTGA